MTCMHMICELHACICHVRCSTTVFSCTPRKQFVSSRNSVHVNIKDENNAATAAADFAADHIAAPPPCVGDSTAWWTTGV